MLISILEQIEERHPEADVLFNSITSSAKKIDTRLSLRRDLAVRLGGRYTTALLRLFGYPDLPLFSEFNPLKNIDLVLDASGFRLSDQWNYSIGYYDRLENYYKELKESGTKIILLPQAFGPFNTELGKRGIDILNKYTDLVIARESVSKNYLLEAGADAAKIIQYPDFTIQTSGVFPDRYKGIKGQVCVIPNKKMITHTVLEAEEYLFNLKVIIAKILKTGREVFLLNHEAEGDLEICREISRHFSKPLPVLTNLNAREIKGVIGASLMVISSRYHGVASALNQGVPCLATSWSHKYEMLFQDFGLTGKIIDVNHSPQQTWTKIEALLTPSENEKMRQHLNTRKGALSTQIKTMWDVVWTKAGLS